MNNEYLWNKTGEDPEIEKLENALAVFRYREAELLPPVAAVDEKVPRWRISLAFAFASCAAAVVLATVWLQNSNYNFDSNTGEDIVFVQQSADAADVTPIAVPAEPPPVRNSGGHDRPTERKGRTRRSVGRTSAANYRRPRTKKDSIAALTTEERHAYQQLMLALSITSSKLKIVQDTIDGTASTENDTGKNRR
jgi:hypothetical protein